MLNKFEKISNKIDKLNSITNINNYPFNLNSKLIDNIIQTKKEIELEYIKNYIFKDSQNQKNIIKGSNEVKIFIY
jgi:hypothetical protein